MGRRHLHNPDDVLQAAMHAFHSGGFAQTSSRDLQAACGVHAGSIYNSFGSKESLFVESLKRYMVEVVDLRIQQYLTAKDARAGLTKFFLSAFDGPSSGCLLNNTCAEFGDSNRAVARVIRTGLKKTKAGFAAQLLRDHRYAKLPTEEINSRAHALLLGFQGYLVVARVHTSLKQRRTQVAAVLNSALNRGH